MKKIIFVMILTILMISSVNALSFYMPSSIPAGDNFQVKFTNGINLVAVEMNMPEDVIIVSDPTGGVVTDGVYRTSFFSSATVTMRALQPGVYRFDGEYTESNGVLILPVKSLSVKESIDRVVCPICEEPKLGQCINGQREKLYYECSELTGYICDAKRVVEQCDSEKTCNSGYTCLDQNRLAFVDEECIYTNIINCENGCDSDTNSCFVLDDQGNLITGQVTASGDGEIGIVKFFRALINWIRSIFSS